ncbi:MAG: mechanosensitive ion channel [Desulfurococcaceae archaeon]
MSQQLSQPEIAKNVTASIARVVVYIVLYVAISAITHYVIADFLPRYRIYVIDYEVYVQILLALGFGYMIVNGISWFFYWTMRAKYDHAAAAAVRNIVRIIGVGAMVAAIAGGVAGGAAGVALGGFLGMVVGFASQQVLGQAIAGLFLLIARPFRINDNVVIAGEEGVVDDVSTLFTKIVKVDGTTVLIPNNVIIGGKIYLKPKQAKS